MEASPAVPRWLYWTPRILCILFAVFISLFALDVFQEGQGFIRTLLALLIHLIPTAFILIVLAVAWRWEWIGALVYFALGLFYIIEVWGRFPWSTMAIISGPLFLIGLLFLLNTLFKSRMQNQP